MWKRVARRLCCYQENCHEIKNRGDPNIHFGKPCIAGTRIPVQSVLELVREGIPFAQIIRDYYPDLSLEDIRASVQYAVEIVAAEDVHIAVAA